MIKRALAVLAVVGGLSVAAAPAMAAGPVTLCYGSTVVVNGSTVLDQSGCQPAE